MSANLPTLKDKKYESVHAHTNNHNTSKEECKMNVKEQKEKKIKTNKNKFINGSIQMLHTLWPDSNQEVVGSIPTWARLWYVFTAAQTYTEHSVKGK